MKSEKKKKKKKYHILSGVSFPWFRDSTRYDFLIQPYAVFAWRTFNRVFKESLLYRKYNAQMFEIFQRTPSYWNAT